jgi:hypothetical protein
LAWDYFAIFPQAHQPRTGKIGEVFVQIGPPDLISKLQIDKMLMLHISMGWAVH